jgi:hypothetical protein
MLYLALSMTVWAGEAEHDGNASTTAAAIVNGHVITQRTLDEAVAGKLFALEQQKYAIRQAALEGLIADVILEQEAKKRNVSVDQLRTSLTQSPATVSRAEVEAASDTVSPAAVVRQIARHVEHHVVLTAGALRPLRSFLRPLDVDHLRKRHV